MARVRPIDWKRVSYHILFWAVYIPLNATFACLLQGLNIYDYFWQAITQELVLSPVKMLLVYFIFYVLLPKFLENSKIFALIVSAFFSYITTGLIYRAVEGYIYLPTFFPQIKPLFYNFESLMFAYFDVFITTSAALSIKMIKLNYQKIEHEKALVREKLSAELDFLRAQTNPHFLFNTLNNLYGLARKKNDRTPDAILMLSKIMRFMLYDCRVPRIQVSGEAKVIKDYIELEKLRYNTRLTVEYSEEMDNPGTLIAPLLLLPFVENSFKHGAHSSTDAAVIRIQLRLKDNQLEFNVENTFDAEGIRAVKDPNASGIGIRNERRQLELIYPNEHTLSMGEDGKWYRTKLQIDLTSDNSPGVSMLR
jgi:two-component system, LytTR family, sensor kinase